MGNAQLQLKKIPLPTGIWLGKPQALHLLPLSLSSRQVCDVSSKGDVAWRALTTGYPCSGLPGTWGHSCQAGAHPLRVGGSVLLHVKEGEGGQGRVRFCTPITAPCENVLEAGAPQPGEGM